MTRSMIWTGFLATLLVIVVLGTAALREPGRQVEAAVRLQAVAIEQGTVLYAENCVICHGEAGQGLGAYPALNNPGVQAMDADALYRTIARGRYNTAMAAYSAGEGGIFTGDQIDSLVTLIQHGDWMAVTVQVAEMGLTPPEVVVAEIPEDTLALVRNLPDGLALESGLTLYVENCAACHGGNGEGTALAPALNADELRTRLTDEDITRIITQGVPGTLMASWDAALAPQAVADLTTLLRRWPDVEAAGVEVPVVEALGVELSPEAVATGQWLFDLLCVQCHGVGGYGSPMAPALNNQLFLSQTPDAAIQQIIRLGVTGTTMPAWGGRLTEADIAALTAYLRSWEPTAPAIVNP